ncbi:MAG: hypothetical protein NZ480_07655 [Bdellovibrionaceae bacterium]|nr:hypothetical protein [Pseudobdellovibrionaceae bacterium]MDW8191075.1 hypothetical protein [Pseudobdellovibrionaceae bacterium]
MVIKSLCLVIGAVFYFAPGQATVVRLGPKEVADLVIQNNHKVKEAQLNPEISRLNYIRAKQILDWHLLLESGLEESRFEPFSGLPFNTGQDTLQTQISLRKNLLSGTQIQLNVQHTSTRFDLAAGSVLPPTVNVWTSSVSLTQSLWRNYFGEAWRREIEAQKQFYETAHMQKLEELETLVTEGVHRFWGVITAELALKEHQAARDRYQVLLTNVRRKQAVGFVNPGELSLVQAELEAKEQSVWKAEVTLQETRSQFLTFLHLAKDAQIEWVFPKDIQSLPPFTPDDFDVRQTRPYRIAERRKEATENLLKAAQANQGMDISLIGQYGIAGVDKLSETARQEWLRADRPRYFVGLRVQWEFGSDVRQEEVRSKRFSLDQENLKLSRLLLELEDKKATLKKKILNQYQTLSSLVKQKNFRLNAVRELTRSYEVGKVDIRTLIDTINGAHFTDLEYLKGVAEYQNLVVEWLALKDELVLALE